jgi:hypothetical protein
VTSKLKGKFYVGYDEILENLVKEVFCLLKESLTFIFNISLCSGSFTDLIILQKKKKTGGKQEISNYTSILILSVF